MIELVDFSDTSEEFGLFCCRRRKISGRKVRCDTPEDLETYQNFNAVNNTRININGTDYERLSSDNIHLLDQGVKWMEHQGKFYLPVNCKSKIDN